MPHEDHSVRLVSLCSDIGRGHPSYLDSVLKALSTTGGRALTCRTCNRLDNLAWRAVRAGYRLGGFGGPVTWLYNRLRPADMRPSRLLLAMLGSELLSEFTGFGGICLVDHPVLAHILCRTCRVAYLHGEIAVPALAAVPEAWQTFVPLDTTATHLEAYGVGRGAITVTGLVVDPDLVPDAEAGFAARAARLQALAPLTVGLFASGAYPRPHVNRIITATASLARAGYTAILFWGTGWLRAARLRRVLNRLGVPESRTSIVWADSRQAETERTVRLLPKLDVMVAAAHERTSWAVGLGLPMFALLPNIGPFAPENFSFAVKHGVCQPLRTMAQAHEIARTLAELRQSGELVRMAERGFGRYPITGANAVARSLLAAVSS
jgi:hypothetical protein